MYTHTVIEDWIASYPDPIQVMTGQPITLDGRKDVWDGYTWLWAKSPDGREGWIPDCIVSSKAPTTALETYTAMELTCHKGQSLMAEKVMHGWVFCKNDDGEKGWIPQRNLTSYKEAQPRQSRERTP